MKHLKLISILLLLSQNLSGQYRNFKASLSYPGVEIVQIDFREFSTLVHMRYVCNSVIGNVIFIDDNFYIKDNHTNQKYKLLNSFNIPLASSNKYALLENLDQTINFTLEFEKLPDSAENLDLIENFKGNGFNFIGFQIDKKIKEDDFLDISTIINATPIKEISYYFKEGSLVEYYEDNGLKVAVLLSIDNTYGKYFQANILIQNTTGKQINFDPTIISAKVGNKNGKDVKVLTYAEYMKKVKKKQSWNAFAVSFSESMAASNAGYSVSSTTGSSVGRSSSFGSAYGYSGNTYSSVYGSTYSYGAAYSKSNTLSYNAGAAYDANQNASKNISNYQNQQYKIKKSLSDGYMKLNTIMNEDEYVGYVNIDYEKTDDLIIDIPLNGKVYHFFFTISKK